MSCRRQFVIFPAKRNDAVFLFTAAFSGCHHASHNVGVEAAAVDEIEGAVVASGGLQDDLASSRNGAHDSVRCSNVPAGCANFARVRCGHFLVLDDAGFGHPECLDANRMRFELLQTFRADQFQAFETIGSAAAIELLESWQFFSRSGHDGLAADLVWNSITIAKLDQRFATGDARLRLDRARPVIESGMDHPTVMTGL